MATLLDTNILLRLIQPGSPYSPVAEKALAVMRRKSEALCVVSQNLFEFWAVATRPQADNGLGLSVDQALREIGRLRRLFVLLPELPLQSEWEKLVVQYQVTGKNSHDARLVAAMRVHQVNQILTFNGDDFARYADLTVLDPSLVV